MRRRWLLFFVLPPLCLLSIIALQKSGILKTRRHFQPAVDANKTYVENIRRWKSYDFRELSSPDLIRQVSNEIAIKNHGLLDESETLELRRTINLLILAYYRGDYASYAKFRLAPSVDYNSEFIAWEIQQLRQEYSVPEDAIPSNSAGIHKMFFTATFSERLESELFIEKLSLDNSRVDVSRHHTQPESISKYASARPNAGVATYLPTVVINPTPAELLRKYRSVVVADCVLLIRVAPFRDPCPLLCRLYWNPDEKVWRPEQLALAYTGRRIPDFIF